MCISITRSEVKVKFMFRSRKLDSQTTMSMLNIIAILPSSDASIAWICNAASAMLDLLLCIVAQMRQEYICIKVDVDVDISSHNSSFAEFMLKYRVKARHD